METEIWKTWGLHVLIAFASDTNIVIDVYFASKIAKIIMQLYAH